MSQLGSNAQGEGYCLTCAKELNIPQISEYLKGTGLNDEDLEELSNGYSYFNIGFRRNRTSIRINNWSM